MCVFKMYTIFTVFIISGTLIVFSSSSQSKRLRLTISHKKAVSSYINGLLYERRSTRRARHLSFKNDTPSGRMKVQLYCRTGFLLEIMKNGRITGTRNVSSKYTILEVQVFGDVQRRLKGVETGRYLSLNSRGRLLSTFKYIDNKNTFFNENHEENGWITYSSTHHSRSCGKKKGLSGDKEWFIAIKRNGALKRPCKTVPGMAATQFVPLEKKRHVTWHDHSQQ